MRRPASGRGGTARYGCTKRGAELDKNINHATLEQLEAVRGISPQVASSLLATRPFLSRKDAIKRTPHFGEGKMKNLEAEGFFVHYAEEDAASTMSLRHARAHSMRILAAKFGA